MKNIKLGNVKITDRDFVPHELANLRFLHSLSVEQLLRNFYIEAGMTEVFGESAEDFGMNEGVGCAIRGHFTGHYLSAIAKAAVYFNDKILRAKAEVIVDELIKCQNENDGRWLAAIPKKYLDFLAKGKNYRVPNYVIHKILMGLFDVYKYLGYQPAFDALLKMADVLDEWSKSLSPEVMRRVINQETGGLVEILVEIYGVTKSRKHYDLFNRFARKELFELLLSGVDCLTNMHANTSVPEAVAFARAYEITGEEFYKRAAIAYFRCAVTDRGYFVTGGNNSGECFIPPYRQLGRMSHITQEHCTSYNLVRLADFLYQWTEDEQYADYIERCVYNSLLPQHSVVSGTVSYFLPVTAGGNRNFCSKLKDFPCCLGTATQANASHAERFLYLDDEGLVVGQLLESQGEFEFDGKTVKFNILQTNKEKDMVSVIDYKENEHARPDEVSFLFDFSDNSNGFRVKLRIPRWTTSDYKVTNKLGEAVAYKEEAHYLIIDISGKDASFIVTFEKPLRIEKMDDAEMYAFLWGAKVLVGAVDKEIELKGDIENPYTMLRPHSENEWGRWKNTFYTIGQAMNFPVMPLCDLPENEKYTVYFPVKKKSGC
ncbi:MAG: beta-L-arabinofuranosidase domain-containing protein [Christensenellales bacterium]